MYKNFLTAFLNVRGLSMYHHHHHLFFIPWIRTGLQNPYGYGNSHVCLRGLVANLPLNSGQHPERIKRFSIETYGKSRFG